MRRCGRARRLPPPPRSRAEPARALPRNRPRVVDARPANSRELTPLATPRRGAPPSGATHRRGASPSGATGGAFPGLLMFSMLIESQPEDAADHQNLDIAGGDYLASGKADHAGTTKAVIRIR